jgi:hypothetical protein
VLSAQQLRSFGERGFVLVPGVLSADLLDEARRRIGALVDERPPPQGHRGSHFYWLSLDTGHPLLEPLVRSGAFDLAQSLVRPGRLVLPAQAQVALTIPPFRHRPGGPHVDGLDPLGPDGTPQTFTLLAGLLLTDQSADDMGNLWVWPGTHLTTANYLREAGPDALATAPYPPVALPEPEQVHGRAGDLLLAHYLLAHNIGGNTAPHVRECLYYRLHAEGHRDRWRAAVQDAFAEFPAARPS